MTIFYAYFSKRRTMQDVINTTENKQLLYKYLQRYLIQEKNRSEKTSKTISFRINQKEQKYIIRLWWLSLVARAKIT